MLRYFLILLSSMLFFTNSYLVHYNNMKKQLEDEIFSINEDLSTLKKEWNDLNKLEKLNKLHETLKNKNEYNSKRI